MKKITTKQYHILVFGLGSIFVLLSIFHINLWFDETYSVGMANHSLIDIWKIGSYDVHPVLYYWMLRIICLLTDGSIIAYRIFSAIPIILLGFLGLTYIKKDFGEKIGFFFTFVSLFLPASIVYANQIRMYSWAILILTLFFIYANRLCQEEPSFKTWSLFIFFTISSMYIHYYALMAVEITYIILFIYFMITKKKKAVQKLIVLTIVQVLIYLPWLFSFINQLKHVSKGYWINLEWKDQLNIIGCQFIGNSNLNIVYTRTAIILSIFLYLYLLVNLYQKRKKMNIQLPLLCGMIYLIVIITAILIQQVMHTPILFYRYLFVITGLYIFVLSYVLAYERNKWITFIICITIFSIGLICNFFQIKENYHQQDAILINFMKEKMQEKDEVIYQEIELGSIIAIHFNNKQYYYNPENYGVEKAYQAYGSHLEIFTNTDFKEKLSDRIWIIDTWEENLYQEFFNNNHFKVIEEKKIQTNYCKQNNYYIRLVERVKS